MIETNMEMPNMNKRKRKLSESKVWPCANCLYEQLLQAKEAVKKAKVALRKAKDKLYKAMGEYCDAMGGECSHREDVFVLWENRMCCPKLCFICCGSEAETDSECDGTNNDPPDDVDSA